MVERTSTRTASRRTTPQSAPGNTRIATSQYLPRRTTRATRSQSRDISDSEESRKSAKVRRGSKQVSSESTDSVVGQNNTKSRKGRRANYDGTLQDLSTLQEESLAYPDVPDAENDLASQASEIGGPPQQPIPQNSKSPGGASEFSGTTARTSLSTQDPADLDPESMLDALPDLAMAADKILDFLLPGELSAASIGSIMTQLHTKGSRMSKNWKRLSATFQAQRDLYGSDSYINPPGALRLLLGTKLMADDSCGPWRPDALLQKANLAILTSTILSHPFQEQEEQFIEELEQVFPKPFTEGFALPDTIIPGTSALAIETLRLALEVRTQYAIVLLARLFGQPNFDSDVVLHRVFYRAAKSLKGWGVVGLRSEDLETEIQEAILQRLEQLRENLTAISEGRAAGVERLRTLFPWTTFVYQTIDWIYRRFDEIERHIMSAGGAEVICQCLNDEIQRTRLAKASINATAEDRSPRLEFNYEPPSEVTNTTAEGQGVPKISARKILKLGQFSASSPKARGAATALKRRIEGRQASMLAEHPPVQDAEVAARGVQSSTAGPSAQAVTPKRKDAANVPPSAPAKVQSDERRPGRIGDGDKGFIVPSHLDPDAIATQVFALRAQRDAESNKENMGETSKVQSSLQAPNGRRRLIDAQADAARVDFDSQESELNRNASQGDDSEDDIFQHQQTPANTIPRRGLKSQTKRAATKPARSHDRSPKKVRVQEPSQEHDPDQPPPSLVEEYKAANTAAKEKKAWEFKPPQSRRPWTEEETERLLDLIEEHGTSWRLLKDEDLKAGNILEARDQGSLKDKARNMKMDFLKSSRRLPPNFDRIPLSKLHIDKLKGLNIIYDPETGRRVDAIVEDEE